MVAALPEVAERNNLLRKQACASIGPDHPIRELCQWRDKASKPQLKHLKAEFQERSGQPPPTSWGINQYFSWLRLNPKVPLAAEVQPQTTSSSTTEAVPIEQEPPETAPQEPPESEPIEDPVPLESAAQAESEEAAINQAEQRRAESTSRRWSRKRHTPRLFNCFACDVQSFVERDIELSRAQLDAKMKKSYWSGRLFSLFHAKDVTADAAAFVNTNHFADDPYLQDINPALEDGTFFTPEQLHDHFITERKQFMLRIADFKRSGQLRRRRHRGARVGGGGRVAAVWQHGKTIHGPRALLCVLALHQAPNWRFGGGENAPGWHRRRRKRRCVVGEEAHKGGCRFRGGLRRSRAFLVVSSSASSAGAPLGLRRVRGRARCTKEQGRARGKEGRVRLGAGLLRRTGGLAR